MEPTTPPRSHEYVCYDCSKRLTDDEVNGFRSPEENRTNGRFLDEDDSDVCVPLCDVCYELEQDESPFEDDDDDYDDDSTASSDCSFYCMGCGEEIDWCISKEEFEEDELHLCTRCERENTRSIQF